MLKNNSLRYDTDNEEYLEIFKNAELCIDKLNQIYEISFFSKNILEHYKYNEMIHKRRENFLYLENNIINSSVEKIIKYHSEMIPLFYPVYINNTKVNKYDKKI